jgi:hypothetical protein
MIRKSSNVQPGVSHDPSSGLDKGKHCLGVTSGRLSDSVIRTRDVAIKRVATDCAAQIDHAYGPLSGEYTGWDADESVVEAVKEGEKDTGLANALAKNAISDQQNHSLTRS